MKILFLSLIGLFSVTFYQPLFAETIVNGTIEAETVFNDSQAEMELSVELSIEYKASEIIDAVILFSYDEEERTFVDESVINFHPNETTDIAVGRQNIPFGRYDTNMISDPVTVDLGETKEEAIVITKKHIAKKWGGVSTSAYLFKDKSENANSNIDNFGVNFTYENDIFLVGAAYLSDVVDTSVAGVNVHAKINLGSVSIVAEHIRLAGVAKANPNASHLEFAYDLGDDKVIAVTYQETSEVEALDLPKEVSGIVYSMPVYKNISIAAEYLNTTDYDGVEDDAITLKLSYEF